MQDDIQRQIQQLRNDGNDEFADFVQGLADNLTGLDAHANAVTGDALALQDRVKALEEVLRAISEGMAKTECHIGPMGDYCYAHAIAFQGECPYAEAERLLK